MYDHTAGQIKTPSGVGKYISYDANTQTVTVEMDYALLVEFDGGECYPIRKEEVSW